MTSLKGNAKFVHLTDTPDNYTGKSGYKAVVNSSENGIDLVPDTGGGGNANFFEATLIDGTDSTYLYFGGDNDGSWQIDRELRTDGTKTIATQTNNPSVTTLNDAWSDRGTLTYG